MRVPERDSRFRQSRRKDGAVVCRRPGEGFSAGNAEIAFVPVADSPQIGDNSGQVVASGDDDGQVDDRFSSQAGHRCAAHVLDALRKSAHRCGDPVAEAGEYLRPSWVVIHDLDGSVHSSSLPARALAQRLTSRSRHGPGPGQNLKAGSGTTDFPAPPAPPATGSSPTAPAAPASPRAAGSRHRSAPDRSPGCCVSRTRTA